MKSDFHILICLSHLLSLLLFPHLLLIFLSSIPLVHSPQVTSTVSSPLLLLRLLFLLTIPFLLRILLLLNQFLLIILFLITIYFLMVVLIPVLLSIQFHGSNAGSVEHSDSNPDIHSPLPAITTNAHPMQTRSKSGIFQPRINPTILLTHCEPKY